MTRNFLHQSIITGSEKKVLGIPSVLPIYLFYYSFD